MIRYNMPSLTAHIFSIAKRVCRRTTILLLHGFRLVAYVSQPDSGPRDSYHVVRLPPGFGFSMPPPKRFRYTFENLANVMANFTQALPGR